MWGKQRMIFCYPSFLLIDEKYHGNCKSLNLVMEDIFAICYHEISHWIKIVKITKGFDMV